MSSQLRIDELPPPPVGKTGWPWDAPVRHLPERMTNGEAWPKISVVTPSFRQGSYLEETIRSVLLQGYPNLQYLVMDGGSDDNSVEILRNYQPWLDYWISEKDGGQADAINKGFARSTGEIMGWLNSDDLLYPRALEHVVRARVGRPDVKLTCGFRKWIDADSQVTGEPKQVWPATYDIIRTCQIAQETVFWNREVWERVGPLGNWRFALDYDYWQRMMAAGYEFDLITEFLGAIRLHAGGKTGQLTGIAARGEDIERIRAVFDEETGKILQRFLGQRLTYDEAWAQSTLSTQYGIFRMLPRGWIHSRWLARPTLKYISAFAHWRRRRRERGRVLL